MNPTPDFEDFRNRQCSRNSGHCMVSWLLKSRRLQGTYAVHHSRMKHFEVSCVAWKGCCWENWRLLKQLRSCHQATWWTGLETRPVAVCLVARLPTSPMYKRTSTTAVGDAGTSTLPWCSPCPLVALNGPVAPLTRFQFRCWGPSVHNWWSLSIHPSARPGPELRHPPILLTVISNFLCLTAGYRDRAVHLRFHSLAPGMQQRCFILL